MVYQLHLRYSVTPRGHGSNMYYVSATYAIGFEPTRVTLTTYATTSIWGTPETYSLEVTYSRQPTLSPFLTAYILHTIQSALVDRLHTTIVLPSVFHPCGLSSVAHTNLVCITDMIKMYQLHDNRSTLNLRRHNTYRLLISFTHSLRIPT